MDQFSYLSLYQYSRDEFQSHKQVVESIHHGAVAIVDAHANLVAWYGDPYVVTYLRSTAKPLQALAFIERKGHIKFNLTTPEIALICASHSGTDEHVQVVRSLQEKTGTSEDDLLCGTHPLSHPDTIKAMQDRGESLAPNRHNCSGKHTGMLALARLLNASKENYIDPQHPVQQVILETFADMCQLPVEQVIVGIDGCSAPNFAVPLFNAALAFARLCEPASISTPERAQACGVITQAMTSNPVMVSGESRFDTVLMQATGGRILSKGGAEGFQGLGIMPGVITPDSPALGIAIKIADGDLKNRAVSPVSLEVLRQVGALDPETLNKLSHLGPELKVLNWRKLVVGSAQPCFELQRK